MRDITAAQSLRGELNDVRLEWAADVLRHGQGVGQSEDGWMESVELESQLALVARLVAAVRVQVELETAEWLAEFRSTTKQLQEQGAGPAVER